MEVMNRIGASAAVVASRTTPSGGATARSRSARGVTAALQPTSLSHPAAKAGWTLQAPDQVANCDGTAPRNYLQQFGFRTRRRVAA